MPPEPDVMRTILKASHITDLETGKAVILVELLNGRGELAGVGQLYEFPNLLDDNSIADMDNGLLQAETVKCVGELLFQGLSSHPFVKPALTLALAAGPGEPAPLYIRVDSDLADRLPWETLYDTNGQFLALDPSQRWPIGRIVASAREGSGERPFEAPVRVMIILAAAGVSGQPEWEALFAAFGSPPVGVRLQVLVCETTLKTHIENQLATQTETERAARGKDWLTVDFLQSVDDLSSRLTEFKPHVLHFFCHGSSEDGTFLSMATRNDWDASAIEGSVSLDPEELRAVPNIDNSLWLVTLNCCQGAAAPTGGRSFARSLVAKGFLAVVAMREPVADDVSRDFSQAFYPALLAELARCAKAKDAAVELLWSKVLQEPRRRLCDRHGAHGVSRIKAAAGRQGMDVAGSRRRPRTLQATQDRVRRGDA